MFQSTIGGSHWQLLNQIPKHDSLAVSSDFVARALHLHPPHYRPELGHAIADVLQRRPPPAVHCELTLPFISAVAQAACLGCWRCCKGSHLCKKDKTLAGGGEPCLPISSQFAPGAHAIEQPLPLVESKGQERAIQIVDQDCITLRLILFAAAIFSARAPILAAPFPRHITRSIDGPATRESADVRGNATTSMQSVSMRHRTLGTSRPSLLSAYEEAVRCVSTVPQLGPLDVPRAGAAVKECMVRLDFIHTVLKEHNTAKHTTQSEDATSLMDFLASDSPSSCSWTGVAWSGTRPRQNGSAASSRTRNTTDFHLLAPLARCPPVIQVMPFKPSDELQHIGAEASVQVVTSRSRPSSGIDLIGRSLSMHRSLQGAGNPNGFPLTPSLAATGLLSYGETGAEHGLPGPRLPVLPNPASSICVRCHVPLLEVRVHQQGGATETHEAMARREGSMLLFHGTSIEAAHSIMQNGLRSMSGTAHERTGAAHGDGIYLATHPLMAMQYTRGRPTSSTRGQEWTGPPTLHTDGYQPSSWGPAVLGDSGKILLAGIHSRDTVLRSPDVASVSAGWTQRQQLERAVAADVEGAAAMAAVLRSTGASDSMRAFGWMRCVFAVEVIPGASLESGYPLHQVQGTQEAVEEDRGVETDRRSQPSHRCMLGASGGVYVLSEPRRARVTHLLVFHGDREEQPHLRPGASQHGEGVSGSMVDVTIRRASQVKHADGIGSVLPQNAATPLGIPGATGTELGRSILRASGLSQQNVVRPMRRKHSDHAINPQPDPLDRVGWSVDLPCAFAMGAVALAVLCAWVGV